ncbi:signal peptidase I [Candidatus Woesearchaeota archaeon]|nr:signal peptidase I [Candidatus Woesearchaeota archaeon]
MEKKKAKQYLKKAWRFIWDDDSIWSWLVNVVLAFIIIKFIVYPVLGFLLGTSFPIVAVVSESMEHRTTPLCADYSGNTCSNYDYRICGKAFEEKQKLDFDDYWKLCGDWYEENTDITKADFEDYRFSNGFNKGDIMILYGKDYEDVKKGDTIVFQSTRPDPIIHRVIKTWKQRDKYYFQTKGDHNSNSHSFESTIPEEAYIGNAVLRIPYLGYIKIWFVGFLDIVGII